MTDKRVNVHSAVSKTQTHLLQNVGLEERKVASACSDHSERTSEASDTHPHPVSVPTRSVLAQLAAESAATRTFRTQKLKQHTMWRLYQLRPQSIDFLALDQE
jgi:hypothetical protein